MKTIRQGSPNASIEGIAHCAGLKHAILFMLAVMGCIPIAAQIPTNMVWITPGTFTLGEAPQTRVTITRGF